MRIIKKSTMLVKPALPPKAEEYEVNGFTLYKPAPGTGIARGLNSERREGEWWPTSAEVIACSPAIFHGTRETGDEIWSIQSEYDMRMGVRAQHIALTEPRPRPSWRVPNPGDIAHFGDLSLNPSTFLDGHLSVDIMDAYCITPSGGSEPWAVGAWALLEQIPAVDDGPLFKTLTPGKMIGHGVLRMAGDGFMEEMPEARPGMVIAFMVYGGMNLTIPSPIEGGERLVPILPGYVVGIDHDGITEEELESLRNAEAIHLAAVAEAMRGISAIKVESPEDRKERLIAEQEEAHWEASRKATDKNWERHHKKRFV